MPTIYSEGYSAIWEMWVQSIHGVSDYQGTGVGLAAVAHIVRLHEGRIWAEGEIGKGATFFFTL